VNVADVAAAMLHEAMNASFTATDRGVILESDQLQDALARTTEK
jgi:hypothetical protein